MDRGDFQGVDFEEKMRNELGRVGIATLGAILYALGINLFVVPMGLYTGGLMGYAQLLRTFLVSNLHMNFGGIDISGIIYLLINVPLLLLVRKKMGRLYFIKSIISIIEVTVLLTIIPIPGEVLIDDAMASCVIAGIMCGSGIGLILRSGSCDGGMDLIGILLLRIRNDISIGKANLAVNCVLYAIMLLLFDFQTVIFSLIYATISSTAMDKVYSQNINVEVHVITKKSCENMEKQIFYELGRGITKWKSLGAYTEEGSEILYIIVNKYEVSQLRRIILAYDPDAFIVCDSNVAVDGHFLKHLT